VGSNYERELKSILIQKDWLVSRSAGSMGIADLIALKPNEHIIIEVKSTKANKFYTTTTKESKLQFTSLNEYAKQGFNVYYYVRWKGHRKNKWEYWKLPLSPYPIFKEGEGTKL